MQEEILVEANEISALAYCSNAPPWLFSYECEWELDVEIILEDLGFGF